MDRGNDATTDDVKDSMDTGTDSGIESMTPSEARTMTPPEAGSMTPSEAGTMTPSEADSGTESMKMTSPEANKSQALFRDEIVSRLSGQNKAGNTGTGIEVTVETESNRQNTLTMTQLDTVHTLNTKVANWLDQHVSQTTVQFKGKDLKKTFGEKATLKECGMTGRRHSVQHVGARLRGG